jgi:hypothetical protein
MSNLDRTETKTIVTKTVDGIELYYDKVSKESSTTISGLSRMLGCNKQTTTNYLNKVRNKKSAKINTQTGFKTVNLINEKDIPNVLEAIINSKAKKETRAKASELLKTFAQAGFRLAVMLEIAPEEVAKEAINSITEEKAIEEVMLYGKQHSEYLESYHGVHGQLTFRDCTNIHHATYNKRVNEIIGVEKGKRNQMNVRQKILMTVEQNMGHLELLDNPNLKGFNAVNKAIEAGTRAIQPYLNRLK